MNQRHLAALSRIIVGPTGRRIAAYPNIHAAYSQGLFADYYRCSKPACTKTYYKYANRTVPYPHQLARHYAGANGHHRVLADMMGIADSASITLLRRIQDEVHMWVITHLPPDVIPFLNENYVNHQATRREVAVYLADVMHYAINADPQS